MLGYVWWLLADIHRVLGFQDRAVRFYSIASELMASDRDYSQAALLSEKAGDHVKAAQWLALGERTWELEPFCREHGIPEDALPLVLKTLGKYRTAKIAEERGQTNLAINILINEVSSYDTPHMRMESFCRAGRIAEEMGDVEWAKEIYRLAAGYASGYAARYYSPYFNLKTDIGGILFAEALMERNKVLSSNVCWASPRICAQCRR